MTDTKSKPLSLYDIAYQNPPPMSGGFSNRKTAADVEAQRVAESGDQGFGGDAVDAFQMGAGQSAAGMAETVYQITGSETAGKLRDATQNWAEGQIDQMSDSGREAMGKQFFSEDENGDVQFGEAWSDPESIGLQFSNMAGQLAGQVVTGFGFTGAVAKVGAKVVTKNLIKRGLAKGMTKEAAQEYAKSMIRSGAGVTGQALAGAGITGGQMGIQVRDEIMNLSDEELGESDEFRILFHGKYKATYPDASTRQLIDMAKKELAERTATAVQADPLTITANLTLDAIGGRYIDNLIRGVGTGKRLTNAGMQAIGQGIPEAAQGGMEQFNINRAMVNEGVDTDRDLMEGVATNALNEGVLGAGMGGAMGALTKGTPREKPSIQEQAGELTEGEQAQENNTQESYAQVQAMPPLEQAVEQVKTERGQYRGIDDDIRIAEQQGFEDEAVRLRAAKRNFQMAEEFANEGDTESAKRFNERALKIYREVTQMGQRDAEASEPKSQLPAEYVAIGEYLERTQLPEVTMERDGETYDEVEGLKPEVSDYDPDPSTLIPDSVDAPYYMGTTEEAKAARQQTERAMTEQQGQDPGNAPARMRPEDIEEIPVDEITIDQEPVPPVVDVEELPGPDAPIEFENQELDQSGLAIQDYEPERGIDFNSADRTDDLADRVKDQIRKHKLPKGLDDGRLLRSYFRSGLENMAGDLVSGGGVTYVRDSNDKIIKRTPSQNPKWFQDAPDNVKRLGVKGLKKTIDQALKGRPLGRGQARAVRYALDHITENRNEYARTQARPEREDLVKFRKVMRGEMTPQEAGFADSDPVPQRYSDAIKRIASSGDQRFTDTDYEAVPGGNGVGHALADDIREALDSGLPENVVTEVAKQFGDDPVEFSLRLFVATEAHKNGQEITPASIVRAANQRALEKESADRGEEPEWVKGESEPEAEEELLTSYTEEDLRQKEADRQQAEKVSSETELKAQQKAKADAEVDSFALTGSDAEADQAAAVGQSDLLQEARNNSPDNPESSKGNEPEKTPAPAGVSRSRDSKKASEPKSKPAPKPTSDLPEILTATRKSYLKKMARKEGLKPSSPGYESAMQRIEDQYETDVDRAQSALSFDQFNELNSDSPEGVNRQAWESLRQEYGEPPGLEDNSDISAADKEFNFSAVIRGKDGSPFHVNSRRGRRANVAPFKNGRPEIHSGNETVDLDEYKFSDEWWSNGGIVSGLENSFGNNRQNENNKKPIIRNSAGNPYKNKGAARKALKKHPGYELVEVESGFELHPVPEGAAEAGNSDIADAPRASATEVNDDFGPDAGLDADQAEPPEVIEESQKKPKAEKPARPKVENKIFTEDAAEKARALLKKKLGQMNSGIDPEILQAGLTLAGYHIEKGARTFAAFAKAMTDDLGNVVKPYLKSWYMGVKYDPRASEFEGLDSAGEVESADIETILEQGEEDALYPARDTQRDSGDGADANAAIEKDIPDERPGESRQPATQTGTDTSESRQEADPAVDIRRSPDAGERSNKPVRVDETGMAPSTTGDTDQTRGDSTGTGRLLAGHDGPRESDDRPAKASSVDEPASLGKATASLQPGNTEQIATRMPFLGEGQVGDVEFIENRLSKPRGFGVLLANGTGTGKTFSGLGYVRRQMDSGKQNILIVTPSRGINNSWIETGAEFFDIEINELPDTSSNGQGVVATTFANFGANKSLMARDWDVIVIDEAHKLSQSESGKDTQALRNLRGLALQPGSHITRAKALHKDVFDEIDKYRKNAMPIPKELAEESDQAIADQRLLLEKTSDESRPRTLMLSATPFAYEKNVQLAQGFLFDWGDDKNESRGYNSPDNYQQFMIEHFGYRMRNGTLNEPEAEVDSDLMQRNFNSWLKNEGVLRGRMLESEFDYDRKFIMTENALGHRVDEALAWLFDNASPAGSKLRQEINKRFDYHTRMYFLEGIKAKEAIPIIRKNLEMGRKVLIMHGYKKGGISNPFRMSTEDMPDEIAAAYNDFAYQFSDLISAFSRLPSAIETLSNAFPDLMLYNGDVPDKKRLAVSDKFNDDNNNAPLLAQGAAMREGVSLHDTTGNMQRVLIHLGMPSEPTATIQQEGRIYRVGQSSNAMFRYLTIGTSWERFAFASRIAERSATAENLAMGELARGLKESYIEAYENAGEFAPSPDEGTGGKANDRSKVELLTDWDKAKAYYFGTKKQGSGRSSQGREGADYFATPEPVGLKMVEFANIRSGESVLEPSGGHGAIARWFPGDTKNKAIEQSTDLASKLSLRFKGDVMTGDFEDHHVINKYDAIVMNPPYGTGGKTAAQHVQKAAMHLREGGRIVALIPTGPAADKKFDSLLSSEEMEGIHTVAEIQLPRSTFKRAGTTIPTRIIVLEKHSDEQSANNIVRSGYDLSGSEDINNLFSELEFIRIPERVASSNNPLRYRVTATTNRETSAPNTESPASNTAGGIERLGITTMESRHTKTGEPLFVVNMSGEMGDYDNYRAINAIAKKNDGFYIRARMRSYYKPNDGGKVEGTPTFTFSSEADRSEFLKDIQNEGVLASLSDDVDEQIRSLASQFSGKSRVQTRSTAKQVRGWLEDMAEGMDSVEVVETSLDLPGRVKIDLGAYFDSADGAYDIKTGKTYIVAGNIRDQYHAKRVFLHEVVGHGGVINYLKQNEKLGGKAYLEMLDDIYYRAGHSVINKDIDRYAFDYDNPDERRIAVLEYIAHLAEKGKKMGLVQRVIAALRDLIRRFNPDIDWTDTDTLALIEKGRRHLRDNGTSGQGGGTLARLSDDLAEDSSLSDAEKSALSKIGPKGPVETAAEKVRGVMDGWRLKVRQGLVDRYAGLMELDKQLLDGNITSEENITRSAWARAKMSNAASGAVSAMMNAGRIFMNKDGIVDVKKDTNGLIYTLNKLGSSAEIERFMGWIAGNRGEKLMAEGRENLFTPEDIQALKGLNRGELKNGGNRNVLYEKVFKEFQQYRDDVLAIAEESGIITSENREMWANEFYVPFYRLDEDNDDTTGPRVMGGLSRQQAYKKLKGGTQNLNDLLQNTLMNFHHLVDASMKNMAAKQGIDNAAELGAAEKTVEAARDKKQSTFILRNGVKEWYDISDPMVYSSLTSLNHTGMNGYAMSAMRWFKRTFTNLTTSTPQFVVANLLRDSMSAVAVTDMSKNAASNIAQGLKSFGLLDRHGYERARLMASGGAFSFGHVYGEDADSIRYQIDGQMRRAKVIKDPKQLLSLGLKPLQAGWDRWMDVNNSLENVNRAAAFKQAEEAGKGTMYAAFQARDLMDFSAHGAWPAVRFLIDVVPFLNARLQGLDKLYRSGVKPSTKVVLKALGVGNIETSIEEKKAAARFSAVVGALSVATMTLFAHNQDDEEYRKAPDWLKDSYWWFRIPETDHVITIPKPFEVGAIATVTERLLEQGMDDEATGKLFRERMWHMLTGTFAFSAVPQMFQPALDVYANKDSFTGRQIETMGQSRLSKSNRVNEGTTGAAKMLSKVTTGVFGEDSNYALSPVQMDFLIGGYLGQIGAWVSAIPDVAVRQFSDNEKPSVFLTEYQPIKRFYRDASRPSYTKDAELFYDSLRKADRLYADMRKYREEGDMEEYADTLRENRDLLGMRKMMNQVNRRLQEIRNRIKAIEKNGSLSAEEKRRQIDLLKLRRNHLIERVSPKLKAIDA